MLSSGVRVNPGWYSSDCCIQLAPLPVCQTHHLSRIASAPHVLLFGLPLDRQDLFHTARRCQRDCWIEFVQIRNDRIFRAHCTKQQSFPCLRLTTFPTSHCMPPSWPPMEHVGTLNNQA